MRFNSLLLLFHCTNHVLDHCSNSHCFLNTFSISQHQIMKKTMQIRYKSSHNSLVTWVLSAARWTLKSIYNFYIVYLEKKYSKHIYRQIRFGYTVSFAIFFCYSCIQQPFFILSLFFHSVFFLLFHFPSAAIHYSIFDSHRILYAILHIVLLFITTATAYCLFDMESIEKHRDRNATILFRFHVTRFNVVFSFISVIGLI